MCVKALRSVSSTQYYISVCYYFQLLSNICFKGGDGPYIRFASSPRKSLLIGRSLLDPGSDTSPDLVSSPLSSAHLTSRPISVPSNSFVCKLNRRSLRAEPGGECDGALRLGLLRARLVLQ